MDNAPPNPDVRFPPDGTQHRCADIFGDGNACGGAPVKILNLRDIAGDTSARALRRRGIVRVDRRTRWGNPYVLGRDGSREQVIARYRRLLWRRIRDGEIDLHELATLAGRDLACWCHPKPCHAEVLARAALWAAEEIEGNTAEGSPDS